MQKKLKLTTVIQEVPEGGFIAYIEEIPGVNTQGETLEETKANLFEALNLAMDYHREKARKLLGRKKKGIITEEFDFIAA
jgi:predicted RNase H-like HicB family nuclease